MYLQEYFFGLKQIHVQIQPLTCTGCVLLGISLTSLSLMSSPQPGEGNA